ncbi:MAG TPA: phosphoribosylglycinamide formyltransferase [Coxiellaceae bacterium]|nr:phosphoribosylglycinamide formyltransferase [Coxiellaceae bacterium]
MKKFFSIVILISGEGSNLQAILTAIRHGLPVRIAAVLSDQPMAYGLQRAQAAGIPTLIVPKSAAMNSVAYDQALLNALSSFSPEWIVLAGFMRLLGSTFIAGYRHRILNIHPALLPQFPGLNTHQRVLEAPDKEHGASVHLVDEGLDTGRVLAQSRLLIHPTDTALTLKQRVLHLEHQLYPYVLNLLATGRLRCEAETCWLDGKPLPSEGLSFQPQIHLQPH